MSRYRSQRFQATSQAGIPIVEAVQDFLSYHRRKGDSESYAGAPFLPGWWQWEVRQETPLEAARFLDSGTATCGNLRAESGAP